MSDFPNQTVGWRELFVGGNATKIAVVSLGVWLHAADGLLVATMIPAIVADIGGVELIGWTFALYEIGSIVAGASGAHLLRHVGLRRAMAAAALIYLAGCATSALAPSMPVMLLGRVLQGLGGGGLMALSFIAVTRLFDAALMPRVMAAISALWGLSAFIGPLIGGAFAAAGLWRGAFWVFAAQAGILAVWLWRARSIDDKPETGRAPPRFPGVRLVLLAAGVGAIAAAGLASSIAASLLLIAAGASFLALFARRDAMAGDERLFPRRFYDPTALLGAPLVMVISFSIATIALGAYGPVVMVTLHGLSPLEAGYVLALESIGWSVAAIMISGVPERLDKAMILGGMSLVSASVAGLVFALPNGPVALIVGLALMQGAGYGIAWTFVLRRAAMLSPPGERDRIASAVPTLQRLGYALGAAAIGIVANAAGFRTGINLASAYNVGLWICIASLPFAALGLFAAFSFTRSRPAVSPPKPA